MNKFKIGIISLFFLLISMSFVNAEHSNMANGTVIVDDNNFDSYFDNDGCLINNSIDTIYFGDMSNKSIVIDKSLSIYSLNSSTTISPLREYRAVYSYAALRSVPSFRRSTPRLPELSAGLTMHL